MIPDRMDVQYAQESTFSEAWPLCVPLCQRRLEVAFYPPVVKVWNRLLIAGEATAPVERIFLQMLRVMSLAAWAMLPTRSFRAMLHVVLVSMGLSS